MDYSCIISSFACSKILSFAVIGNQNSKDSISTLDKLPILTTALDIFSIVLSLK